MYPYYDLAVTLIENGRNEEAEKVIQEAKAKSPLFSDMEVALMDVMKQMEITNKETAIS